MQLELNLPPQVIFIFKTLKQNNFDCFLVGGAVRDILLKKNNLDFDFATNATPEQILKIFNDSFYENDFGTVMITHDDLCQQAGINLNTNLSQKAKIKKTRVIDIANASKIHHSLQQQASSESLATGRVIHGPNKKHPNYEITTYRSEGIYRDFRRPSQVSWGKTLEEDLKRRDFTINALALEYLGKNKFNLIDLFDGQSDLKNNLIRTVGDADERFREDALRMLRAIRLCVQLNMQIESQTFEAIFSNWQLIKHISWERIRDEFIKILKSNYPAEGIELLDQTGLLKHILPELLKTKNIDQSGHHTTDVWTHSLDSLRECPSKDPIVRLATLLHDIAKPQTQAYKKNQITFYAHEILGSRIASKIARRLRFSKKNIRRVFVLVRYHMFHYQPFHTDAAIRRFMRKVGLENVDDILDLREGDRLGSGARKTSWRLEEMKQRMIKQLHQPMDILDLDITGHDIMKEFGLKPSPIFRDILKYLLEQVLDEPELNQKTKLLKLASEYLAKNK